MDTGAGCLPGRKKTGYRGRVGVFELLILNETVRNAILEKKTSHEIRELAFARAPTTELKKAAVASGMKTLMDDGVIKIFEGVTTPEEVAKIAQSED